MGTRSTIAVQHKNGTVSKVYCHFDGHPSHNGKILSTEYPMLEQAEALVCFGRDIRYIDADYDVQYYNDTHYLNDAMKTKEISVYKSLDEYYAADDEGTPVEFDYLFADGQWLVTFNKEWVTIDDAIVLEKLEDDGE